MNWKIRFDKPKQNLKNNIKLKFGSISSKGDNRVMLQVMILTVSIVELDKKIIINLKSMFK